MFILHDIFAYFISKDGQEDRQQKQLGYLSWFVDQFPEEEFQKEEAVFYDFLRYCSELVVPAKEAYLEAYMSTELKRFLLKSKVRVTGAEGLSYEEPNALETAVSITRDIVSVSFREIAAQDVALSDFPVYANKFMQERLDERTVEVLGNTYDMISKSDNPGEAALWAREQLTALSDIYDLSALEEITDSAMDAVAMEPLMSTGIPAIDRDIVALCRTQLLDISGGPASGKTRLTLGLFGHGALMKGLNVLYYTLEQTKAEAEAILVARHVLHLFGDIISDKMILMNTVPKELISKVAAARIDLFESSNYGRIEIQETDLYLENFVDKIKTQDRVKGPFDMVIIDHMSLMQSMPPKFGRQLDDYKVISKSYRKFKQYIRKAKKGGISVNQFNREGVTASKADKEIDATMGAGGMEAYRSTDINLVITCTEVMKAQGQRRISMPKTRSSQGFGSVLMTTKLGCGYWAQQTKRQV